MDTSNPVKLTTKQRQKKQHTLLVLEEWSSLACLLSLSASSSRCCSPSVARWSTPSSVCSSIIIPDQWNNRTKRTRQVVV